jgi:3-hydroxy-D-aspartate aldolase
VHAVEIASHRRCSDVGVKLRPHGKTHKSTTIAREQIGAGSAGVCVTTGREAIVFAEAGIPGLLVTTPIVQRSHIARLAELYRAGADIMLVFDTLGGVADWERSLDGCGRRLPALVDLDLGMARTGAGSVEAAVAIAQRLMKSNRLAYAGLQAYSGRVQHIQGFDERRKVYGAQLERLKATQAALAAAGLAPAIVSGGGTGTFAIDAEFRLYNESQAGSYLFMDVDYDEVRLFADEPNPYEFSLFLRTSVISANRSGHVTIDAGFKSLATDGPLPQVRDKAIGARAYQFFGDEFGMIELGETAPRLSVGDHVDLITPHCDPTVNLHDFYHVIEGDTLIDIWPIDARGVL